MSEAYKKAGVDVTAGYEVVERIKKHVSKTQRMGTIGGIGGFGGLFDLGSLNYRHPVLVSGTDGVGTKLMLAIEAENYATIGIDCVAMCVNDVVAQGAEPLFFLDYIAVGKNEPRMIEDIVAGVALGCQESGVGLIGGETAEMPDMYGIKDFDLAGFTVGVAEKENLLDPHHVQEGDLLIGLASSGLHSNGYSLVRKILFKDHSYQLDSTLDELGGQTLEQILLTPTKIYVKEVLTLHRLGLIHGVSHITGGGFIENIPRMLPKGLKANIQMGSWPILPIFQVLASLGNLSQSDLLGTFNMGIGLVLAVAPEYKEEVLSQLEKIGTNAYVIGQIVSESFVKNSDGKDIIL